MIFLKFSNKHTKKSFTIIEMIICIAILGFVGVVFSKTIFNLFLDKTQNFNRFNGEIALSNTLLSAKNIIKNSIFASIDISQNEVHFVPNFSSFALFNGVGVPCFSGLLNTQSLQILQNTLSFDLINIESAILSSAFNSPSGSNIKVNFLKNSPLNTPPGTSCTEFFAFALQNGAEIIFAPQNANFPDVFYDKNFRAKALEITPQRVKSSIPTFLENAILNKQKLNARIWLTNGAAKIFKDGEFLIYETPTQSHILGEVSSFGAIFVPLGLEINACAKLDRGEICDKILIVDLENGSY